MLKFMKSFLKEESGQSMIEYVVIMALLVVVVIIALRALGGALTNKFTDVQNALERT